MLQLVLRREGLLHLVQHVAVGKPVLLQLAVFLTQPALLVLNLLMAALQVHCEPRARLDVRCHTVLHLLLVLVKHALEQTVGCGRGVDLKRHGYRQIGHQYRIHALVARLAVAKQPRHNDDAKRLLLRARL